MFNTWTQSDSDRIGHTAPIITYEFDKKNVLFTHNEVIDQYYYLEWPFYLIHKKVW